MTAGTTRGFTLVEVLVALMIVAIGLAALMTSISGAANASGYLRDKALAQWIAMNRIVEVRLRLGKIGENTDKGSIDYAHRQWHYDTRYYDTSIPTMRRIVVRVWAGQPNAKGNPLVESIGFIGTALSLPGAANVDWTQGSVPLRTQPPGTQPTGTQPQGTQPQGTAPGLGAGATPPRYIPPPTS